MNGIEIRPMAASDLEAIMEIERRSFATPWSYEAFLREVEGNKCAMYLVLVKDGDPIAYAGTWLVMDEGHITNIAVHPDHRGSGYGSALTKALMERAAARGITWMTLEVRQSNRTARAMYERLGFFRIGIRKGYYENGEHADLMVCERMPEALPDYDIVEEP